MDKLSGKYLPDLTSKEVTKEEAAARPVSYTHLRAHET